MTAISGASSGVSAYAQLQSTQKAPPPPPPSQDAVTSSSNATQSLALDEGKGSVIDTTA